VTFDAATVAANKGKTITVKYTAVLNNKAVVGTADTNEVKLDYGQNYSSVSKSVVTKTYSFTFDKVDGSDKTTKLTGAEFQLTLDGETPINLIQVEAGKTYRVAMSEDTATPVTTITTTGETVTILGIDTDVTYKLVETKAPTGYNKLDAPIEVTASGGAFAHQDIENNKGAVLPSTGGIGTTIFYILGAALVIGCGIVLISRKRMQK
jgi:LPXTG-motif cell wall-anchored protein